MKTIIFLFTLLFLGLAGLGVYYFMGDREKPQVYLRPDITTASTKKAFTIEAEDPLSGIKSVSATVTQGQTTATVFERTFTPPVKKVAETFSIGDVALREGEFDLTVTATDGSIFNFGEGNTARVVKPMTLDNRPPAVTVLSLAHNVRQGGTGFIVYTVSEDVDSSGIRLGNEFYPGFLQSNGLYYCFFPFPMDMDPKDFNPVVTATDVAGNTRSTSFRHQGIPKKFRQDRINISDGFLQSKMPQFQADFPNQTDLLDVFIKVNNEMRAQNVSGLLAIGKKTAPTMLWEGDFLRLPNAAPRAQFGDHRDYYYKGKKIDKQTHMGLDLASLEQAEIPAANNGIVVMAAPYGIYGNCVVIDHGLGLQTLYSHLSQIRVKEGDHVNRGDIIGNTGVTGMAGGDHLHFGVLVHGLQVQPIEWFDLHWIKDNVIGKIPKNKAQQ
ncbi:M23 family metallopeptidase [Desulfovibrio inopinatus]|uniref:M23 family metallopeptidase n=1 Tax=Desulfovibrio inopinatus TaxID=102109 RepID=UPI00041BCE93|nr:M23 family metallopeptidase [Desulfovibrio inopinatus]